jgi:hypothetical protein
MPAMNTKRANTRSIEIRAGRLLARENDKVLFDVRVDDIAVVGEFTTNGGPWLDDHHVVFVTRGAERELRIATDTDGFDRVRGELKAARGIEFEFMLANRTDWATAVLWPPDIRGRPLYEVEVVKRAGGVFASLLDRMLPRTRTELTAAVRERCVASVAGP